MPKNNSKKVTSYRIVCLALAIIFIASSIVTAAVYRRNKEEYVETGYAMGSLVHQTLYGKNSQTAADEAMLRMLATEALISYREENSDISKINNSACEEIEINERTAQILKVCLDVAEKSSGAFDPTVLPVSRLWNFDAENPQAPNKETVEDYLRFVSYKNISLNANKASLLVQGGALELGACGKGAACDDAVYIYKKYGLSGALVYVGGSIGVYGDKPDKSDWKIAIRDPNGEASEFLGVITVSDCFISTSGSYEKNFTESGKLYHHILDTKTGFPVETDLVSVTVIAESGVLSDALSTACFALGIEKSKELLESYGASAIFADKSGIVSVFGEVRFELTNEKYTLGAYNEKNG